MTEIPQRPFIRSQAQVTSAFAIMYRKVFLNNLSLVVLALIGAVITIIAWGPCFAPWNTACFTNGAWGDYKFHYQGWINYLHGPSWVPPYTLAFTWPQKSSVMFTDSIPIAAILAKPFTRILGLGDWQYFSALSLINSIIIAWSVSRIGRYRSWSLIATVALGVVLLTSSLSWSRLIVHHEALQLHGILILGMTWVVIRQKSLASWLLLISVSVGIHAYYTPMILACFLTYIIGTKYRVRKTLVLFVVLAISAYVYGFLPGSLSSGSEVWGANMLSLIDPQDHSAIFSGLRKSEPFEIEGYSYLGLGIIVGCLAQIFQHNDKRQSSNRLFPLAWWTMVIAYYFFAFGHTWNVGDTPITPYKAVYAIPGIPKLYDVFRSSGRFSWPLVYSIAFWLFEKINSSPRAPLKVLVLVLLQLLDSNLRVIARQGTLYSGLLNKRTNPVTAWAHSNKAIAESIKDSELIIVGSIQNQSNLPPSYTPQYLSPASMSNWGGDGITRLPSKMHETTDLQYWIGQHLAVPKGLHNTLYDKPVSTKVTIYTEKPSEIKQLRKLTTKLNLNFVDLGSGFYKVEP